MNKKCSISLHVSLNKKQLVQLLNMFLRISLNFGKITMFSVY